ncbi:hypothetical protein [uncultured Methanobrevibacter sp.]|uniref:hypothetical protein n=1 Tax=uncultured Methanobrevibacter sp. TaxID=253161 RepID=UPI0025E9EE2A|nr:hypothetical protein [uncultured Methanobrevibacter sp.]
MVQNCKFYKEKKQVSYDNGVTFVDVVPAEYRKGELIERDSPDCGYVPPTPPASGQYLTFVAIDSGTFSFSGSSSGSVNNSSIQYSLDSGSSWNTLNRNTQSPTVSAGQKIMWKESLTPIPYYGGVGVFSSTGRFNIEGNIMSLLYSDNFIGQTSIVDKKYVFSCMFSDNRNVINTNKLVLPSTNLSGATNCYFRMFSGCTSLTTAPELPATSLAGSCYVNMFDGCSSLTTAPALPATTLARQCYSHMFNGCTSLTTAPELPATTLEYHCYWLMFYNCTSLTTAPVLSATTLVEGCYTGMFRNCSSLNYIKCLATNISATDCTSVWLEDVSSSGTFVKASSMSSWPTGENGIPSGWTVTNA